MSVENPTINSLITVLLVIIPIGAAARLIYCALKAAASEEEAPVMKKRAKNIIVFTIIAETAMGIVATVIRYYL